MSPASFRSLLGACALLLLGVGASFAVGCSITSDAGDPLGVSGASGAPFGVGGAVGNSGGSVGAARGGAGGAPGGLGGSIGSSGGPATSGGSIGSSGSAGSNGNAGASGSAGASGGSAGAGDMPPDDDYLKTTVSGYGFVRIAASSENQILSLVTTLNVPIQPSPNTGTLFLWPGLQPGGANYEPIDNGVLQPVLTWGPTCAPNSPNNSYASWWVSAQYVNTFGSYSGYTGCLGGDGMNVQVGDTLRMAMTLNGTVWSQTVTDTATQASVSYDVDMLGQAQNYAEFVIEQYTENPAADVVFTGTVVTFASAEAGACQPATRGMNDFFTNPRSSVDGTQCAIDRIVLRAEGVPASTPN